MKRAAFIALALAVPMAARAGEPAAVSSGLTPLVAISPDGTLEVTVDVAGDVMLTNGDRLTVDAEGRWIVVPAAALPSVSLVEALIDPERYLGVELVLTGGHLMGYLERATYRTEAGDLVIDRATSDKRLLIAVFTVCVPGQNGPQCDQPIAGILRPGNVLSHARFAERP